MAERPQRQMTLTMFMTAFGYHNDAWMHPNSRADEIGGLALIRDMAQAAERAKLDAIFIADSVSAQPFQRASYRGVSVYEPVVTLAALIGSTEKIGLLGTQSTTFNEPYTVARQFAELDVLSGGRAGWNIVTSINGGENYGRELPPKDQRYARATEFVDVVKKLWASWDADAIVNDRERGLWVDPDRLHRIDHVGEHFRVEGPLTIPPSPQGHPVLVQAGQSPAGIELGTSVADIVYTVQPDHAEAQRFYAMYKDKAAAKGRDPEKVRILPGIMPITGHTQREAEELARELEDCIHETNGRRMLENFLDFSIADLSLDERIPQERFVPDPSRMERWNLFRKLAEERTVRELMVHLARAVGHRVMVATPDRIAESMIEWFDTRACDGYNFNMPSVPEGMQAVYDLLVPELQERGYFREEYVGDTMRERSGLTLDSPVAVSA